jgi:quinol-cytochrome oxidoreductase complex cytochrome b subunit
MALAFPNVLFPWTSQEHTITIVFSGDVLRSLHKTTKNFPTATLSFHWFLQTSTNISATR